MPNQAYMELKSTLELAFQPRDFQAMWFALNAKYKALDFRDDISDSIRISEYKYIVQQFRKYISGLHDAILIDCDNVEQMMDVVNNQLGKAAEYGKERKEIAYNFLRDDWLYELAGYLTQYMYDLNAEEEEDE